MGGATITKLRPVSWAWTRKFELPGDRFRPWMASRFWPGTNKLSEDERSKSSNAIGPGWGRNWTLQLSRSSARFRPPVRPPN